MGGGEELDREYPLFEGSLPVQVIGGGGVERGKEVIDLTLRVLAGTRLGSGIRAGSTTIASPVAGGGGGSQRERLLHIEITDDRDSFFLYTLDVGEEDFHELKRDQSLLVDFNAFPKKFIELVSHCLQSSSSFSSTIEGEGVTSTSSTTTPTTALSSCPRPHCEPHFLARLDTTGGGGSSTSRGGAVSAGSGLFSIVEANQFKELTHLSLHFRPGNDTSIKDLAHHSLQFRPGNDTTIKIYLSGRLRQMTSARDRLTTTLIKTEALLSNESQMTSARDRLTTTLMKTEARLNNESQRCKSLEGELHRLSTSRDQDLREIQAAHIAELATLRERLVREMEEAAQKHAQELRTLQQSKDQMTMTLQKRLDESEARRGQLSDLRHGHEASIRELTKKSEALESSLQSAESEMKELRRSNRELENCKFGLEKEVNRLQLKCAALEQQVIDRDAVISKTSALQTAAEQARSRVEESLEMYKANSLTLQEKLEASVAEINKGNQIIQKLQGEYRALKAKLRLKGDVMKQQERVLQEKEHSLAEANRKLQSAADSRANLEDQLHRVKRDLAQATSKLEESNKLIESNQQVITWLNKEINEAQVGRGHAYAGGVGTPNTTTSTYVPSYHRGPDPASLSSPAGLGLGSGLDDVVGGTASSSLFSRFRSTPLAGEKLGTAGLGVGGGGGSSMLDAIPKTSLTSY